MEYTRAQVLERAGVSDEFLVRLAGLGLIAEAPRTFSAGDLRRVRFLHALNEGGLPLDGVATAVASGDLSLAF